MYIAKLEADLAHYKGRGEKRPRAANKRPDKSGRGKKGKDKPKGAGGGRGLHKELRLVEEFIWPSLEQRTCPLCGEVAEDTGLTADSDEVDWRYEVVRRRIRRKKCKHSCGCRGTPKIVTAAHTGKALRHSKYSDGFWIYVLLRKFHLQIPFLITIGELESFGLKNVKETTLIGGLKSIYALAKPLLEAIIMQCKTASLHGSGDSRLSLFMHFDDDDGKHDGYLWQHNSMDTVVFDFVRRRSGDYLADFFSETKTILVVDRHNLYKCKAMAALSNVVLAFCWAHQRRDFEKLLDKPGHKVWAGAYLAKIRRLYKCNNEPIKHVGTPKFFDDDKVLRARLAEFKAQVDSELAEFKNKQTEPGTSQDKLMGPRQNRSNYYRS